MQKSLRSDEFGLFQQAERAERGADRAERFPAYTPVVLPDGQLMYVRVASLVAAKDLLAAQHAAERRMREAHAAPDLSSLAEVHDLHEFATESSR